VGFEEVEQWISKGSRSSRRTAVVSYGKYRLLRAKNRAEAFRKRSRLAVPSSLKTRGGEWRFAGISMLLPIYEDLEDGARFFGLTRGVLQLGRSENLSKTARAPGFQRP